jgi:GH15 family glucan-1,4-alpha-glucosidase
MASPIEDYALVGDCQTAALVARNGSIDWLCFPRFDSPACFASLLGDSGHGRWQIAPAQQVRSIRRRYRDETLILETEFETDSGKVAVIDFMPPRTRAPDVVRIVEGRGGLVPMRCELAIRFEFGSIIPWVRSVERGLRATAGPDTVYCRSDVELRGENMRTVADFKVSERQRAHFTLTWAHTYSAEPAERDAEQSLRDTETWWREWTRRCTYQGLWREAVVRSLITLKALTYAPTGALVAAPTTSLPEKLGGQRMTNGCRCFRSLFMEGYPLRPGIRSRKSPNDFRIPPCGHRLHCIPVPPHCSSVCNPFRSSVHAS